MEIIEIRVKEAVSICFDEVLIEVDIYSPESRPAFLIEKDMKGLIAGIKTGSFYYKDDDKHVGIFECVVRL